MLKVGELARRTGLTVRTLHHYDSIGLLKPSARSDGGYRLYNQADITRLHGIQVLRRIGLPLDEIGRMLDDDCASLPLIIGRQMRALQHEIAQAQALHDRLALVQRKFDAGSEPPLDDWLDTLQLMSTCDQYFSPAEMKRIFGNWPAVEAQWQPLVDDVRRLMAEGVPALDPRVQPLAQRWMNLMHVWMEGDFDLMERWGRMYLAEPGAQGKQRPTREAVEYIEQAVQLRLSLWRRHLSQDDLHRLQPITEAEWQAITAAARPLMAQALPPQHPQVMAVLMQWRALGERSCNHDPGLRARVLMALAEEPLLREAALMPPDVFAWLRGSLDALMATLPPDVVAPRSTGRATAGA